MTIFDKYDLRLANDIYNSGVNLAEDRHDWIVLKVQTTSFVPIFRFK